MTVNNDIPGLGQLFPAEDVRPAAGARTTNAAEVAGAGSADEATLSDLGSLAAQAGPDSDVRMAKVSEVQQAVAAGTYQVQSVDVADKMIDRMLEH